MPVSKIYKYLAGEFWERSPNLLSELESRIAPAENRFSPLVVDVFSAVGRTTYFAGATVTFLSADFANTIYGPAWGAESYWKVPRGTE